jgi:hypothetical protein
VKANGGRGVMGLVFRSFLRWCRDVLVRISGTGNLGLINTKRTLLYLEHLVEFWISSVLADLFRKVDMES